MGRGLQMDDGHCAGQTRRGLLQHLKPFAGHRRPSAGEAGDVGARMSEARNEAVADRIADADEHHRHIPGHRLEHRERKIAEHHDDVARSGAHQHADLVHAARLGVRLKRPGGRDATEQSDELPPLHGRQFNASNACR
jgi:hypothetical protein